MSKSKLSLFCLVILLALPSMAFAQRGSKGAPPVVSSIAPTSATAGGPGFALTVSGSNFSTGSIVLWNGSAMSTTYASATQLQGTIPGTRIAAAGTAQVAVYTPGRSGGTSNNVAFTINPASTTTTTTTTETPLAITTTSLPAGTTGTVFSQALAASGGTAPYVWSTTSGAVPPGLTLSSAGAVSGTPTTAGSYSFTAQVADSASHTATYTYPVVISTAPLAIATTSVPAGTAGSPYGTTLAASGGTPPHNWSTTSGAVPPGLAISAAGAISGTPATAGSYAFTAQVADSASHTAAYTYTLTVGAPTPPAPTGPLFQTGFEGGSLPSGWDAVQTTATVSINSNPSFVHSGSYSGQIHYTICGDSTNTACGAAHQDVNRYFSKDFSSTNGFPNGLDHFFLRGYVYLKSPEPGGTKLPIQRKLVYFMENNGAPHWSIVLDTFSAVQYGSQMSVTITTIYTGSSQVIYWDKAFINYDQWYCLELEIKANTPGLSDGVLTLWVNGTPVWQTTTANLRGSYTTGIGHMKVGDQSDRGNYLPVDEYRYWDDVVISTSYIGP